MAPLLLRIRILIFSIAEVQDLGAVEESLKWGEPSYSVKNGSTVRFDWKPKYPEQYYLFFNCKTQLVDTFRELYSDILQFEGNRTIVLNIHDPLPESAISQCIELSLTYKSIKHLPLLGA
ncbi:DUF1801 domain-containing protein [Shewanella sp. SM101]|nr:DUF1801 domain-containing protein [Shewanella sp. SM95]MCU8103986.1 DUF1801 domain-containing protein [Shewanella sp. SM101]